MAARDNFKDAVSIQLVAFPQSGVIRRPGTIELLEEAKRVKLAFTSLPGDALGVCSPPHPNRITSPQPNPAMTTEPTKRRTGGDLQL